MAWINGINCQIISLLKKVSVSSKSMASILPDLTKTAKDMESQVAQQTEMITQMVATQTSMAESLEQIVSLLQIQNQQIGNIITSSPELTTVATTNEPTTQTPLPADCSKVSATDNHGSGVYTIDPRDGSGSFKVFCDMDNGGGGWTVFQKRFDGSVDFFLRWDEYEQGFGDVSGEYWLGLQQVHRLTSSGRWTLRIDMEDFGGNVKYAQYEDFQIGDAASFYKLSIGAFSGTANNGLTYHNDQPFSTKDSDHSVGSCTVHYQGAWWYYNCHQSHLNGLYLGSTSPKPKYDGSLMCWEKFSGGGVVCTPIKKSEMKIRRVQ